MFLDELFVQVFDVTVCNYFFSFSHFKLFLKTKCNEIANVYIHHITYKFSFYIFSISTVKKMLIFNSVDTIMSLKLKIA